MNELTKLGVELQTFCEERHWKFCVIDGLAVQHWGEPRFMRDVEITLLHGAPVVLNTPLRFGGVNWRRLRFPPK